jgi:hypothetical protein
MTHLNANEVADAVRTVRSAYFRQNGHREGECYTRLAELTGLPAWALRQMVAPAGIKTIQMDAYSRRAGQRLYWDQEVAVPAFPEAYKYIAIGDSDEDLVADRDLWRAGVDMDDETALAVIRQARTELDETRKYALHEKREACGCIGYYGRPCANHDRLTCERLFQSRAEVFREHWVNRLRLQYLGETPI